MNRCVVALCLTTVLMYVCAHCRDCNCFPSIDLVSIYIPLIQSTPEKYKLTMDVRFM